jgi:glycosyltransferase involved in cell wall biosynthesis
MHQIGAEFGEYKIVLYYDRSTDRTLEKLKAAQSAHPNVVTLIVNHEPLASLRTVRIAKGRNACMSVIRDRYADYGYFVVMDCDDKGSRRLNVPLLRRMVGRPDWDSVSFQYPGGYYDTWALAKRPLVYNNYGFRDSGQGGRRMEQLIKSARPGSLISVISAFNGLAIYRTPKFLDCVYDGRFNRRLFPEFMFRENVRAAGPFRQPTESDCEHKSFHVQAGRRHGARIRICPQPVFL